jgi:ABC-type Mn2+/Zn2+ transport system permease subunit
VSLDFLSLGFMQRALLAGVIISLLCGTLSVFVVLRRMAFVGVGISHSAFGGIALGFLLSINPTISGIIFTVMVALLIGWVSRRGKLEENTAIGIFFAASMALGVLFIGLSKKYNVDVFSYLFGNILAITPEDIRGIIIIGALELIFIILLFKELVYWSFDDEMAKISGLPVEIIEHLFLAILAVAIIISIKLIGIILVSSLLVAPGAAALMVCRDLKHMFWLSIWMAIVSTLAGLFISYWLDIPSGSTIVLLLTGFFLASLLGTRVIKRPVF